MISSTRHHQGVSPRWGSEYYGMPISQGDAQGVALGYRVDAPLARKTLCTNGATLITTLRTKGAKPVSPGHRAGSPTINHITSPERAKPNHIARWVTPRWGLECCGVVGSQGDAQGYRVDAPLARKTLCTNGATLITTLRTKGAKPVSPGHRPGSPAITHIPSPERAKPNHIARWVTPRWGLECCGVVGSQGVALGYRVDAPLARKTLCANGATLIITLRANGAKPVSPWHRPGSPAITHIPSPERAKPNHIARWVTPRWGLECCGVVGSQGVALGYRVDAPLVRKTLRTKGAKPVSPGHRPGSPANGPIHNAARRDIRRIPDRPRRWR